MLSTFSPSTMSAEALENTFVQRHSLLERLVDIFEDSARRKSKHNVLLVGPRGIGKSHVVSLVYQRLKANQTLADKLVIAFLKEDEWGITSFLDLLLRVHRAALDDDSGETPRSLGDLSKLSKGEAEERVWRSLRDLLGKRTLLLIVENLDAIFDKIGEQGQQQLRALIQTYPQWAILATTPGLFSGVSRQISPFYGFFEVIHLQPLSFDDAVAFMNKLASYNGDDRIAAFLNSAEGRARLRAVQHLAGGNHRIFVIFYDFLCQSESDNFVAPLLKTVDALTPYYQSQMAHLSRQQQKIVNFLCEYRRPATVTTIASNCLTTHQTAASQLKQLLQARYLLVDRVGRESFYELAEPLLRICVEAKTHSEQPLHLLVDFIRYWFSREELERKLSDAVNRDPHRPYFAAALQEYDTQNAHEHLTPEIASLCSALNVGEDSPEQLQRQAKELAELSKIAEDWYHYARALVWLNRGAEAVPILERELAKDAGNVYLLRSLALAYANAGSPELAQPCLDLAIAREPRSGDLLYQKGLLLAQTAHNKEALDTFDAAVGLEPRMGYILAIQKARIFLKLQEFAEASNTLAPFVNKKNAVPEMLNLYGISLLEQSKEDEALGVFDRATRLFPNYPYGWGNKGITLSRLGRYQDALKALNRALSLDPSEKHCLYSRCEALLKTQQYALAIETASAEDLTHNIFHELLAILNDHQKQGKLQQQVLELRNANQLEAWQSAFLGGLIEFASFAASNFSGSKDCADLDMWNRALQELFTDEPGYEMLLKLFDVLTRVKVLNDRKALLELPREQRQLLMEGGVEEPSDGQKPVVH
jgi:tetratricopeptide (TPR) repeat protein